MNRRNSLSILRWVALGLIFILVLILNRQLMLYSRMRALLPPGLTIGGVPVGGLNGTEAGERLVRAYGIPIELIYGGSVIQVRPSAVGFSLNIESGQGRVEALGQGHGALHRREIGRASCRERV